LRRRLEHSLGFRQLPWPPSLEPRIVGTLRRNGYRIEKVVYQTLPGVLAPAHLYIPDGLNEPAPAIVFYPGHWRHDSKSRPSFQAFCINMARLGFVVLAFDPVGQGERGVSSRDHRRTEALLAGISHQGFAEYDTQCAIEYLLSREEVDPQRIGMTGASGGGYNTWMTAALDDSIMVAVPVVGTSDLLEQIRVLRPLGWRHAIDHCHIPARLIRYANNHELLAMVAPRPLMIIAASEDQSFPVNGVRQVHSYGRGLYESYEVPERFRYFEDSSSGHGYQQKKREAAYGWFLKWLMNRGDGGAYPEPRTETLPYDAPELRCFPVGRNQPAGPGMVRAIRRLAGRVASPSSKPRLEAVLGALPEASPLSPNIRDLPLQRLEIPSEDEIDLPAFLLQQVEGPKGIVVALHDQGKEALASDPVIQRSLEKGWAVCGIDPRGIGELKTSKPGWVFAVSLLLGENFVWRQAWDVRRTIDYLSTHDAFRQIPFGLYAYGDNAVMAAMYSIAQLSSGARPKLRWFLLQGGFLSFRHFYDRPENEPLSFRLLAEHRRGPGGFDKEIPMMYFVFEGLRHFDLPQLLRDTEAQGLIVNPLDGDWNRLAAPVAQKLVPPGIRVVSGAATESQIREFLEEVVE
jgi:dienelactone hydrolase